MEFLIPSIVAAAVFVAAEFFTPVDPAAANRHAQRHFWATILSVFSLVLGLLFTLLFETRKSVEETAQAIQSVSRVFSEVLDPELTESLEDIMLSLDANFDTHAGKTLRAWVDGEVKHLQSDLKEGYVPLAHLNVQKEVQDLLNGAKSEADEFGMFPRVIATNVGSTRTYFKSWYLRTHERLAAQGVPVIRYFLFDPSKKILLRSHLEEEHHQQAEEPRVIDPEEFRKEVADIHDTFKMLYSAVIDVDACDVAEGHDLAQDLLLVNDLILLNREMDEDTWEEKEVRATGLEENLNNASDYFKRLHDCVVPGKSEFLMPVKDVGDLFRAQVADFGLDDSEDELARLLAMKIVGVGTN